MNLHQLRFVLEAVRQDLNLTDVARVLHTSQPGISRAILEFEKELGFSIFARQAKRLTHVTTAGQGVVERIELILREIENLKRFADDYAQGDEGILSIATTHTQARYVLPEPIAKLRTQYPKIEIGLHQGSPKQVARMLIDGIADIGLATEVLAAHAELITLPCYTWQHVLITPRDHHLAHLKTPLTLKHIAAEPIITYHASFTGRSRIDRAFKEEKLEPHITLEAIDADVIKTYVRLGLGIGIVAEMAMRDEPQNSDLVAHPLHKLFGINTSYLAFARGTYLRGFVYDFIQALNPKLGRAVIEKKAKGI